MTQTTGKIINREFDSMGSLYLTVQDKNGELWVEEYRPTKRQKKEEMTIPP